MTGVAGEVAERVAEFLVGAPAEGHGFDLAGLPGRGRDPGQAGQRVGGGKPAAGVADLGEQPGGPDGPERGRVVKIFRVRVDVELFGDAGRQGLDLGVQGAQHRDVAAVTAAGCRRRAGGAAGAAVSRAWSTAGSVRPL